ncbi:uncharacterized protein LOC111138437 isoform X3 [Crassostrea virginica]
MFLHVTISIFPCLFSPCMSDQQGRCDGPLKCCRGFQWEEDTKSCTACLYPGYGRGCRLRCNCSETDCSRYIGCKIVSRTGLQEKGDRFAVLFGKPPPRTELSMSWFRSTVANVTCTQREWTETPVLYSISFSVLFV